MHIHIHTHKDDTRTQSSCPSAPGNVKSEYKYLHTHARTHTYLCSSTTYPKCVALLLNYIPQGFTHFSNLKYKYSHTQRERKRERETYLCSSKTTYPKASHIFLIWRFLPSCRVISIWYVFTLTTLHGSVGAVLCVRVCMYAYTSIFDAFFLAEWFTSGR
jgi:hypothetical protein